MTAGDKLFVTLEAVLQNRHTVPPCSDVEKEGVFSDFQQRSHIESKHMVTPAVIGYHRLQYGFSAQSDFIEKALNNASCNIESRRLRQFVEHKSFAETESRARPSGRETDPLRVELRLIGKSGFKPDRSTPVSPRSRHIGKADFQTDTLPAGKSPALPEDAGHPGRVDRS